MAKKQKNAAAVELGRMGGKKKFANMTPEQMSQYQREVALRGWETRRKKDPNHGQARSV
jgi:hypothetical protein